MCCPLSQPLAAATSSCSLVLLKVDFPFGGPTEITRKFRDTDFKDSSYVPIVLAVIGQGQREKWRG